LDSSSESPAEVPEIAQPAADRRWVFVVLLIAMLAVDQAIKFWAQSHLAVGQYMSWPWPGVLELQLTHNEGIAFGLAQGKGGWFTPIALLISFGSGWYSWKHPKDSGWLHVAMALLASGALGNLFDRVMYGYVRDMFATRFVAFPVFNLADACITVATVILILVWSKEALDAKAQPPRAKADEAT
jgi:signal peptidase II